MNSTHEQREYEQSSDTLYRTQKSDMLKMTFKNDVFSDVVCISKGKYFSQYVHILSPVLLSFGMNV